MYIYNIVILRGQIYIHRALLSS